jgi:hypothetical protein
MTSPAQARFLDWLIGPDHAARFWSDHWEKQLFVAQARPGARGLLNLERLDQLLATTPFTNSNFNMAQSARPIAPTSYCNGSRVEMGKALAQHRAGATIILRAFEQWCPELESLCRAAHDTFHVPAQTNVYMTPPENQSSPPHWDTHDIFILQVHGEKVWKIYESTRELPLPDEGFVAGTHAVGPLLQEFTMRPGDVLYMPRGVIHEPRSTQYSVHVSLGIRSPRWVDLMVDAIRQASYRDSRLRETPIWASGCPGQPDSEKVALALQERIASVLSEVDCGETVRQRVSQFIEGLPLPVDGLLVRQIHGSEISLDTAVSRRPGVGYQIEDASPGVRLRWAKKSMVLPANVRPALRFIAEQGVFSARQIPGTFSDTEKLNLVRSLLESSFLRLASERHEPWS